MEKCFICAEETSQLFRNLMQLTTKYSGTLIYKLVERFLEGDLSDNAASLIASAICQECMVKLNDYDAAHTKAIIIQKEFADLLRKNIKVVGNKIQLEDQMYFKVETDGSYLDELVVLDQIGEEEAPPPPGDAKPPIVDISDSSLVSMKCNTCGVGFSSLYEMQQHTHRSVEETTVRQSVEENNVFCVEVLDIEGDEFSDNELEYINEERLEEEDKEKANSDVDSHAQEKAEPLDQRLDADEEIHFEQFDFLSEADEPEEEGVQNVEEKPSCQECALEFSSMLKLKNHVKKIHPEIDNDTSYRCNICGLKVTTRSALVVHKAEHSKSSNFDCTFCGKKFRQKGALARHVPIHTGERPHQCDTCGKQFIHYSSFHMHKLSHGDIREKKCEICGYQLRSSSHLKRHMRVHSGEKPFECPTCGQKFAQRYNMMTHLKAHQGIYREYSKMYKCPFCINTFTRKLKLQEHLTREHNTVLDSSLLKPVDRPKKQVNNIVEVIAHRSS
ncbi:zinc finger protein OZF-like [Armigeres subalbatus]|uniref:zinc finger protein OZF-like n=1 Tax=Armigeres subalbatus TaxID=124917 RepID=UPI002ED64381